MIIIEGMDNSGKTTLLNYLHETLELPWVKSPGPEHLSGLSREDWFSWIDASLSPDNIFYLYDRHPLISEVVYGWVLRNYNAFSDTDFHEKLLLACPLIIYCRPPKARIFSFGNREQMLGVIEQKERLLQNYDIHMQFLKNKGFEIVTYNYTTMSEESIVKVVNRYLNGMSILRVVK